LNRIRNIPLFFEEVITTVTEYSQTFPTKDFLIQLIIYDLTQQQIADYIGVSRPMVARVVNNLGTSGRVRKFLDHLLRDMEQGRFKGLESCK